MAALARESMARVGAALRRAMQPRFALLLLVFAMLAPRAWDADAMLRAMGSNLLLVRPGAPNQRGFQNTA
ncbi:MAG: macrolide ABC transporter permease/ATP-binding protein MacB, partial [Rhizobiales bacterium]|nr:macrolide ABC transporter permease/ATP-binding protein MacB [Rhizobacter sp.]